MQVAHGVTRIWDSLEYVGPHGLKVFGRVTAGHQPVLTRRLIPKAILIAVVSDMMGWIVSQYALPFIQDVPAEGERSGFRGIRVLLRLRSVIVFDWLFIDLCSRVTAPDAVRKSRLHAVVQTPCEPHEH